MSSKPRLYADSCIFIEAVKHRKGIPLSGDRQEQERRENDCWFFRQLCDASRAGAIQLVTSMLTVAECVHVSEHGGPSRETRDLFVDFLTSGRVVHLVEPDLFVAERARDLHWLDGILLSGADSLHVASAILDGCTEFLTLDGKIRNQAKFAAAIPLLHKVGLAVIRPSETGKLPNEHRSEDLVTLAAKAASESGEGGTET
jgi:predicted nucleic acid-binding protein